MFFLFVLVFRAGFTTYDRVSRYTYARVRKSIHRSQRFRHSRVFLFLFSPGGKYFHICWKPLCFSIFFPKGMTAFHPLYQRLSRFAVALCSCRSRLPFAPIFWGYEGIGPFELLQWTGEYVGRFLAVLRPLLIDVLDRWDYVTVSLLGPILLAVCSFFFTGCLFFVLVLLDLWTPSWNVELVGVFVCFLSPPPF